MRRIPVAREALVLVIPLLVVAGAALLIQWYAAALLFLTLATLVAQLFRDPDRETADAGVLSPADGVVIHAGASTNPPDATLTQQISIVSSLFDVHVIRAPIGGRLALRNGTALIESASGSVAVAHHRGILSGLKLEARDGEQIARGGRIGMTRMRSQVDLFLPAGARLTVSVQQQVKVGLSVVAELE